MYSGVLSETARCIFEISRNMKTTMSFIFSSYETDSYTGFVHSTNEYPDPNTFFRKVTILDEFLTFYTAN